MPDRTLVEVVRPTMQAAARIWGLAQKLEPVLDDMRSSRVRPTRLAAGEAFASRAGGIGQMKILAYAAALVLAGCNGAGSGAPENEAAGPAPAGHGAARTPASDPGAPAAQVLTAEGFGPLRIGMSRAEVMKALGGDSDPEAVGGPDPESCDMFRPVRAPEGMLVMIEEGRLTSISLTEGSKVATDRGLRLGATAASVRAAYGKALRAEPHKYEEVPAEYLTVWAKHAPLKASDAAAPGARGINYEIGGKGLVQAIHAGGPSIQYVEGCA